MADNEGKIRGTVFDVKHTVLEGKKIPGTMYNKYIFTIEVGGKYPTTPELEYFGTSDLGSYEIGDLVEVEYDLRGKPLERKDGTKYIRTTATITKMSYGDLTTKAKHVKHVDTSSVDYSKLMVKVDEPEFTKDESDDLPF